MTDPTLFGGRDTTRPLADRMRPNTLDDLVGQEHILGEGKPLREAILRGEVPSLILWGPPGSGKTTLAYLVAKHTDQCFEPFSAVTAGLPRVREIIAEAEERQRLEGRGTILFCDEIHRFNRGQQDAFLPWVERGVITLIGATTENPSFELNAALLSRCQVYVLHPLSPEDLRQICARAAEGGRGTQSAESGARSAELSPEALELIVQQADGDARRALNILEAAMDHVSADSSALRSPRSALPLVGEDVVRAVLTRRMPQYDKSGEGHYNLISALHKAVRGSDADAALYWLARMVEGGENPLYLARRVVRMASEDIGLADPRALSVALAAKEAYDFLGSPEGELAIAEAVVYLATAPKSNRVYAAWSSALAAARETPAEPVPLHIRNAPTSLMKELGYGSGYRYDHAEEGAKAAGQEYLPDAVRGSRFYEPTDRGFEKTVAERLAWWEEVKKRAAE